MASLDACDDVSTLYRVHGDDYHFGKEFTDITDLYNVCRKTRTGSDRALVSVLMSECEWTYSPIPTGIFTHERMTSDEYGELLRRCFQRDAPPIQVPTCYNTTESGGTKSAKSNATVLINKQHPRNIPEDRLRFRHELQLWGN
ncbi:hypothetical protein Tco_0795695 [Tanacetum coccineum]